MDPVLSLRVLEPKLRPGQRLRPGQGASKSNFEDG
jgi:hypothetical protein